MWLFLVMNSTMNVAFASSRGISATSVLTSVSKEVWFSIFNPLCVFRVSWRVLVKEV